MATRKQLEVFARTVRALEPYAGEIVLIRGSVHALYIAEADTAARAVYTSDIDFTVPPRLTTGNRPALIELVKSAGFELDELDSASGTLSFWQIGERNEVIDLDLITEAPSPRDAVPIDGQPGLVVQGYPDQHILLENTRWVELGPEIHELLDPPCQMRIPTIPAYVLVKGLSSGRRPGIEKRAKDLVYLYEIVRDKAMAEEVRTGMPDLTERYTEEYRAWREILTRAIADPPLRSEMAMQLRYGSRAFGTEAEIARSVVIWLRRILGETPNPAT